MGCALWAPCKVRALWGFPQPQHKARKIMSELRICCGAGATFCSTALLCLRKALLKLNCSRTNCSHEFSKHSSDSLVRLSRTLCIRLCHCYHHHLMDLRRVIVSWVLVSTSKVLDWKILKSELFPFTSLLSIAFSLAQETMPHTSAPAFHPRSDIKHEGR